MTTPTTLDQLQPGGRARVASLANSGTERRRFMDLGILPGARIEVELQNPLGDPTAYRVRGAVIALRREQAHQIAITLQEETETL